MTIQDIYNTLCSDLFEDSGLSLGLLTQAQFFNFLNLTVIDFQMETGINLQWWHANVSAGTSLFTMVDAIMRADDVLLGGIFLEPTNFTAVSRQRGQWNTEQGDPNCWNAEEIPNRSVQVIPSPQFDSTTIGDPTAPDAGLLGFPITESGGNATTMAKCGCLTVTGPSLPATLTALTDPLPFPQDFAMAYLGFGVLQRVFSTEGELQDLGRANWCGQQYQDGLQLCKMIMGEDG